MVKVILKMIESKLFSVSVYRFFKKIGNTDISAWKSKRLSDESIKPASTTDNSLSPKLNHIGFRTRTKFDIQCLKQDKFIFNHKNLVNIYIAYEVNLLPFFVWCCQGN